MSVWDESKHPRGFHGYFAKVLAGLKTGDHVTIKGSGVKVTAVKKRRGVGTRREFHVQHPNAVGTKRGEKFGSADAAAKHAEKVHTTVVERKNLRRGSKVEIGRSTSSKEKLPVFGPNDETTKSHVELLNDQEMQKITKGKGGNYQYEPHRDKFQPTDKTRVVEVRSPKNDIVPDTGDPLIHRVEHLKYKGQPVHAVVHSEDETSANVKVYPGSKPATSGKKRRHIVELSGEFGGS